MRVLITGGAGFVGRHFNNRLVALGEDVTVVDIANPFEKEGLCPHDYWHGDFRAYVQIVAADAFDLIIHCAAVVGGRLNIEGDPLGVATDLAIDADLFNWVVRAEKKPQVIYFSSSAAYPIHFQRSAEFHPQLTEGAITFDKNWVGVPDYTYGWSKLSGEFLAQHAVEKYGLDVKIYRPFGGYGEDQDLTYPFPAILKRVIEKQDPIVVWGSGEQCRDFIHIDDIVDIVLATKDRLQPGEALNLGRGIPTSFRELAETMCNVLGHKADIVSDLTKPQGVFYRVADTAKLKKLWDRPFISLETGIQRAVDSRQPVV